MSEEEHKEEHEKHHKADETINFKINKQDLWKYSTFLLVGIVVVIALFSFFGGNSGNVIDNGNNNAGNGNSGTGSGEPEILSLNYEELVDNDAVLGDENAPVTIIEFSDYQCPFCARHFLQTNPTIESNLIDTGKAKLIFRDFPLTNIHPQALPAGVASECVREQGGDSAFYEYHDLLFENQDSLSEGVMKSLAQGLGYDIDSCLSGRDYTSEVQQDLSAGSSVGVAGTPGFIILMDKASADLDTLKSLRLEQGGRVLVEFIETSDGQHTGIRIGGAFPYATFEDAVNAGL